MDREKDQALTKTENTIEEKKYHLKGGMVETKDGELVKSPMFDIFNIELDDYSDIELSLTEMRRVRAHIMNMKSGIQAMAPLLCSGPQKCPFAQRCPLLDRSLLTPDGKLDLSRQNVRAFPLMRQCPFEREYLNYKRTQYAEEFEIDPESPTEMGMINRLAVLDLYEYRLMLVLAHGDKDGDGVDLMKLQAAGMSKDGELFFRREIHPAWIIREKIHREREDILKAMVATRHEQFKQAAALNTSTNTDPSSRIAELRQKIDLLEGKDPIIEAEVIDNTKTENGK